MKAYKCVVLYNNNGVLATEVVEASSLNDITVLRRSLRCCKNVLLVTEPIVWFGADGHPANRKSMNIK